MLRDERLGLGATPEDAEAFAHRRFGNRTAIREAVYEMPPLCFLLGWTAHLRIAIRTLLRNKTAHMYRQSLFWHLACGVSDGRCSR